MDTLKISYDQFCRLEFKRRLAVRHIDALRSAQTSTPARAAILSRVADALTFYANELARTTGMLPEVAESDVWTHWERLFTTHIDAIEVYPFLDTKADSGSIVFLNQALDYFTEVSKAFPPMTAEELAELAEMAAQ